jgi:cell wall-associated NlpC family hydrolase
VHTPLPGMRARLRMGAAAATAVVAVIGLSTYAVTAGAAPQPTQAQAQAMVNQYNSQYDQANQQYDQVAQQEQQAQQKLAAVNEQVAANEAQFTKLRGTVAQIAAASYESGDTTSVAGLLTSNDPNTVLNGESILLEISGSRNQQVKQFLAVVRQLRNSQEQAQRTKDGLAALEQTKKQNQQHANNVLTNAKAVLASLTPQQQQAVTASSIGAGATTATAFTGSTATQGGKAAAFAVAEAQAACPYVYGATGPCGSGFDCSGLALAAWGSAGITIPRTTYEQWAQLPHISLSALIPGDLILYDGEGHVSVYVGNGMIVDAPHSGANVEEVPMSEDWYAQNEDGAVRP